MSTYFDQDLVDAVFTVTMCALIAVVFMWGMKQE